MTKRRLVVHKAPILEDDDDDDVNDDLESKQPKQSQHQQSSWNLITGDILDMIFGFLQAREVVYCVELICKAWFTHSINGIGWKRNTLDITTSNTRSHNISCLEKIIFDISSSTCLPLQSIAVSMSGTVMHKHHRRLTQISKLQYLTMSFSFDTLISKSFQNIADLTLHIVYESHLSCSLSQVFQNLTSLTSLSIINRGKRTNIFLPDIPTLRSLTIKTTSITNPTYITLPFSYPLLTKLHIGSGVAWLDDGLVDRCKLPRLEHLKLYGSVRVDMWHELVRNAGNHLLSLEHHSFSLGFGDIIDLSSHCSALQSLKFKPIHCTNFRYALYVQHLKRLEKLRNLEIIETSCNTCKHDYESFSILTHLTSLKLPSFVVS